MSQRYNDNIKRPKLQDTQLGILKIYVFCQKIQQRVSGPGESAGGVTQYLSLRIHRKTWCFKEGCRSSIAVTQLRSVLRLHAYTSIHDIYSSKQPNWRAHLELCHRNPKRVLNQIAFSTQLRGTAHPYKFLNSWNMGELQQPRNKDDPKSIIINNLGLCKRFGIYLNDNRE